MGVTTLVFVLHVAACECIGLCNLAEKLVVGRKSCESWVGMQQIRVNCYRAFHSTDQAQDRNALLESMHMQCGQCH